MIALTIPGYKNESFELKHLVLDFNGTIAMDGKLLEGMHKELINLSNSIEIHIVTGDTYGTAKHELKDIPCNLHCLQVQHQRENKIKYINELGAATVVSIGNGRNDKEMLLHSAIGISVLGKEGASTSTLAASVIICSSIFDALNLLKHPLRLKSCLRS